MENSSSCVRKKRFHLFFTCRLLNNSTKMEKREKRLSSNDTVTHNSCFSIIFVVKLIVIFYPNQEALCVADNMQKIKLLRLYEFLR